MKPLKQCANGCDRPPDPPSKVICSSCQQAILRKMEKLADSLGPECKHCDGTGMLNREPCPRCHNGMPYLTCVDDPDNPPRGEKGK